METLKITCPNCGHEAGELAYEPARRRNLPPLADKVTLEGPDPLVFGSWIRDDGQELRGKWHRPADLHKAFSRWWVSEGGAPFAMPGQRRMSAALIALGWVWKNTKEGRAYRYSPE